jgi:hypothetical protein
MLAEQFLAAAAGVRNSAALDETARLLWRAHTEGHLDDADAEAVSDTLQARRAALAAKRPRDSRRSSQGFLEAPDAPFDRDGARRCSASAARAGSTATPRSESCIGRAA